MHVAATAYCPGKSIWNNAEAHVKGGAILKFDFANFFPSIVSADWHRYCQRYELFDDAEDILLSANVLFSRSKHGSVLRLAIGAPSSPILSNILMTDFDERISQAVAKDKVIYTRYADDITFSAKRAGNLSGVELVLRKLLRNMPSPKLRLNEKKTVLATRKYRRVVTGLVLADDGQVSLGHERKRNIRAAIHRYCLGKLDAEQTTKLVGLLAFVNSVEPDFLDRLASKYGAETLAALKTKLFNFDTD